MVELEKSFINDLFEKLDKITEYDQSYLDPDSIVSSYDVYSLLSFILDNKAYIGCPENSFIRFSENVIEINAFFEFLTFTNIEEHDYKPYVIVTKNVSFQNSFEKNPHNFSNETPSWVACVILPNSYKPFRKSCISNGRKKVLFLIGYMLKPICISTKVTLFTRNDSISFDLNLNEEGQLFNNYIQQIRPIDSGFWAIYNALMFVYKKQCNFLNKFQINSPKPAFKLRFILHELKTCFSLQCNKCEVITSKSRNDAGLDKMLFDFNLNDPISDSIAVKDYAYFPRCEYYARYLDTTCFYMAEPEFWGTYFRSTSRGGNSDRYAKSFLTNQKTYDNPTINYPQKRNGSKSTNSYHSKTGSFCSPFSHKQYSKIIFCQEDCQEITRNVFLYDRILKYKQDLCHNFVTQCKSKPIAGIEPIYSNQYPCILVLISCFNNERKYKKGNESWYKVAMSYYVAIANFNAENAYIPIELVVRSSFGHVLPSVDSIANAFRINIGIVPNQYIDVLVKSLNFLGEVIQLLSCHAINENVLKEQNEKIWNYNHKIIIKTTDQLPFWTKDLFETLNLKGDKSGRKVIVQITRKRSYIDLFIDLIIKVLHYERNCYASPLIEMLRNIIYDEKITLDKKLKHSFTKEKKRFNKSRNIEDENFWNLLMEVKNALELKNEGLNNQIQSHDVYGLYAKLDMINKNFICNSGYQNCEDGIGSDSDCDGEDEDLNFYIRKVTVSTGMRAINLATFLSLYYITKLPNVTEYSIVTNNMYYETEKAVKEVINAFRDMFEVPIQKRSPSKFQPEICAEILFFDLNFCNSQNSKEVKIENISENWNKNYPVIIDYTSATTEKICCSVLKCLQNTKVVLLVNSGLKNEQFSADINPYGTLRIIAKERKLMLELYDLARQALEKSKEILPSASHQIRKAYKDAGFVVTNEHIFKDKIKVVNATDMINNKNFEEKIFHLWNLSNYIDEINILKSEFNFNRFQIIECSLGDGIKETLKKLLELNEHIKPEEIKSLKLALDESYRKRFLN